MTRKKLMKPDFKKDTVYLVQFPRTGCIPSLSPFALKMETWLRMSDIPFQNLSNNMTQYSSKGLIPFIELNGKEYNDSNNIIEELIKQFNKQDMESGLTDEQLANMHAYLRMNEESLRWALIAGRKDDMKWVIDEKDGMIKTMKGPKKLLFKMFGVGMFKRKLKKQANNQGLGRLSKEELEQYIANDLIALDTFLGTKPYFMGDKPSRLDASVFGTVAQLMFTPSGLTTKATIETRCHNLSKFIESVKTTYWADWDELTSNCVMNNGEKADEPVVGSKNGISKNQVAPADND